MDDAPGRDAARTRQRILAAAREHFARCGFDRATVRVIAADAGVAPNLITRYFGGKRGLFDEATRVDLQVHLTFDGPLDELGARIATHVVRRWEDGPGNDPLLTMIRAATSDPASADHMAEFYRVQAREPLAAFLGGPDADERASAAGVFIMGTIMQRYVLRSGPPAEAGPAELVAWMGEVLQRVLTGDALPLLR